MERSGDDLTTQPAVSQAGTKLTSRLPGEGQCQNTGRFCLLVEHSIRDPAGEDAGFARAGTGVHDDRSADGGDRLGLLFVQPSKKGICVHPNKVQSPSDSAEASLGPVAYPRSDLNTGEEVVLDLRPHWWYFSRQVVALLAAMAIGIVALGLGAPDAADISVGVLILIVLGWLGFTYVVWATTNFVVTTDRLISRSGVLTRQGVEIPLERINTVFFRQNLWERFIRSGDLEIESASEQGSSKFSNIRRPLNVQNEIYRQMESNENRKFDRVGRNLGGSSVTSIPEQIEKLDELRRNGVLTEEEFSSKKAELLRRI